MAGPAMKEVPTVDVTQSVTKYMNALLQMPKTEGGAGMNKEQAKMAWRFASEYATGQRSTFTQGELGDIKRAGINKDFVVSLGKKMGENLVETDQDTKKKVIAQYEIGQINYSPETTGRPSYMETCKKDLSAALTTPALIKSAIPKRI